MAPRHSCEVQTTRAILNRIHIFFHFFALLALLYYRFYNLFTAPSLPWAFMTFAELFMAYLWVVAQPFRWRPVVRTVIGPEELKAHELPGLDVYLCTCDPKKEPVLEVMNSVISALSLDYPPEKLAVYVSDDAGSPITREAIKEAARFAKVWIPFCRKYNIKTRCPDPYFTSFGDGERLDRNEEFKADELLVKSEYEAFKSYVEKATGDISKCTIINDRAPYIEIIHDEKQNGASEVKLPLFVYVSREKRPGHPHRAKAGAVNTLLRVSGLLSNGPFCLVLDCDMYCNDPTSARQAMCFHLDPKLAPTLAFVQFPQVFYNSSKNDIYDSRTRSAFRNKFQGMDGQRGPVMSGTGYFLKKKALYGSPQNEDELLRHQPQKVFGPSDTFIASLDENSQSIVNKMTTDELLREATSLATCTYESNTSWGTEIGYSYECLLESAFRGYLLHCKGWRSAFLYPNRPCFLGCATIDMNETMLQILKWTSGWLGVGISKSSPLTYGISRMSVMQSLCYACITSAALISAPLTIYGIIVPYSLWRGIPVFPKIGDPWLLVYVGLFASVYLHHLYEVFSCGEKLKTWWNEQRIWVIKGVSACLFGFVDCLMNKVGILKASFKLTDKSVDKQKLEKYEKGKFDFSGAAMFMIPLSFFSVLNLMALLGGIRQMIINKNYDEMFVQLLISSYVLVLSYPILEWIGKGGKKRARFS